MQARKNDAATLSKVSLIDENGDRRVRMGNLAFIGSHKVNGVSGLHTELMKQTVFADLHTQFPDRINNKTNGITPRRWLHQSNKPLSDLITSRIGTGWIRDLEELEALKPRADEEVFREEFRAAKRQNKKRLARVDRARTGCRSSVDSMFDVQVKRIHEYKRQLLNVLQTIALYNEMRDSRMVNWVPLTKIFAGKAAPSYRMAKLILKLINDVAKVVNQDPSVRGLLKIVFLPNYNVTPGRDHHPGRRPVGADLDRRHGSVGHRQHEAGAQRRADDRYARRRQCRDSRAVGAGEHLHLRPDRRGGGSLRHGNSYNPRDVIAANPPLKRALDMIASGVFSPTIRTATAR